MAHLGFPGPNVAAPATKVKKREKCPMRAFEMAGRREGRGVAGKLILGVYKQFTAGTARR